jgi:PKD domain/Galactose oxidase, central domain
MGVVADARQSAASVSLRDGGTLILGGVRPDGSATDTVVVFDPLANTVTPAGYLSVARTGHTATLLDDGRVLIAGGTAVDGMISADVEVFDPSSGNSTPMALLAQPRTGHAAARLVDGRILIVGGTTLDGVVLASAELIAPVAGSIVPVADTLHEARTRASATTLIDGRVLIVGGTNGGSELATAEIFEPASQAFTPIDTQLSVARSGHAAVLLPYNAGVLIAGGTASGTAVAAADVFLPAEFPDPFSYGTGTFASTGSLTAARTGAVGGPAGDAGYAFVTGGGSQTAEKYRYATIRTDKEDYAPGEFAVITGSGWQPGEDVRLLFQEDPAVHPDYVVTVTADLEGNIYWDQWAPEEHDLNVRFYLLASDSRSRAQTTFTDGRLVVASVSAIGSSANITYRFFAGNATCTGTATPTTILLADGATHTVAGQMGTNQSVRLVAAAAATNGATFTHWTVAVSGGNAINVDLTQPTLCVPGQGGTGNNNQGTYTYTAVYTAAANTPPSVNAGGDAAINEGTAFAQLGSLTDPDADVWTATVDYGDGTGSQPLVLNPDKTFALGHTYADNGSYTVIVTVTDDDGGVGSDTIQVTVDNVAPTVTTPVVTPEPSTEGSAATASATFSDPGTNDAPFTCTVDYGDGSGPQAGAVTGNLCEGPAHTYADNSSYTVVVAVTDKDGATGSNSTTHVVNNVAPTGTLENDGPVNEGSPATISFAGQFDPSSADTSVGFRYSYSCMNDVSALATAYATATTNPSTTCAFGDNGSYAVIGRIFDKDSGYTDYTTSVTVNNVAPSYVGHTFSFNPYTGAASASVTFSDSGWLDRVSSTFRWTGVATGGTPDSQGPGSAPALAGAFSSSHVFGSGCITNAISARVMDDDAGYFDDLLAAADTLGVYSVTFMAPIKDGIRNVVKHGNVIPIKVSIRDCKGNAVTNKTLTIALVSGIVSVEDVGNGAEEMVPTSVSSADSTGVMRVVDSHYMYNMATKGLTIGHPYTVVIRDGTQIIATAVVDTKK